MRLAVSIALWLAASACSESSLAVDDGATRPEADADADIDTDAVDSDDDVSDSVIWWSFGGTIEYKAGNADLSAVTLTARYLDAAQTSCEARVSLESAVPLEAPPEPIASAWTFQLVPVVPGACGVRDLAPIAVGIGPIDPQLHPAMDRAGYPPESTSALGLYADPGAGWVTWGLTGTAGQLAGEVGVPAVPPLPDGLYAWVPLFLLPFSPP